jgi:HEAT repeat protein
MTDRDQIISPIGPCGCGTVSRGWDSSQSRGVIVTRYPVQGPALQEFSQNARKLYTLRHPTLVLVYDSGTDDEGGYLITEMTKGEPLEKRVSQGPLTEDEFVQLTRQVLESLTTTHATGLMHLNLHPDNLTLPWNASKAFQVKIINFNLTPSAPSAEATQRAAHFMAPEQFGQGFVDLRTDLYALGTVLYYALTQQHPFQGTDSSQIIISHLYHRFVPLASLRPDLPTSMCAWVERLMSQDIKDRPATASEALRIFNAIVHQESAVFSATPIIEEDEVPVLLQQAEDEEVGAAVAVATEEEAVEEEEEEENVEAQPEASVAAQEDTEHHAAAFEHEHEPAPVLEAQAEPEPALEAEPQAERSLDHLTRSAPRQISLPVTPPRRRTSTVALIVIAFIVTAAGMLAFVSYVKFSGRGERQQRFIDLTQSARPVGSDLDVRILFEYLDDPTTRDAAATVLSKLQGGDYIDTMIVEHLRDIRQNTALPKLIEVIGERKIVAAFPEVLPLAHDHLEAVRRAAWSALGQITVPANLPQLIGAIRDSSPREHEGIQNSIATAVKSASDRGQAIQTVQKAYQAQSGNPASRTILFKVLVHAGGPETVEIITAAIADPATPVRLAAITELAEYPTHDPLAAITARFAEETDATCRMYLIVAATELIDNPGPSSQETLALHAQSLYANGKTPKEKERALTAVSLVIAESTATFYENFANSSEDPALKQEALSLSRIFKAKLAKTIAIAPTATATLLPAAVADSSQDGEMTLDNEALAGWNRDSDWAAWTVQIPKNGAYEVTIRQAHAGDALGTYEVLLAGQTLLTSVVKTPSDAEFQGFIIGQVTISQPGTYRILLRPKTIPPGGDLFRVQSLGIKLP